jgi:hypothetical protein
VSKEYHEFKKNNGGLEEVYFGKCTYEGGYFNIHYMTHEELEYLVKSGSEPMRNMFSCARALYCDLKGLPELVAKIPVFQKSEAEQSSLNFIVPLRCFIHIFGRIASLKGLCGCIGRRHDL